jgi:hypothetical protein
MYRNEERTVGYLQGYFDGCLPTSDADFPPVKQWQPVVRDAVLLGLEREAFPYCTSGDIRLALVGRPFYVQRFHSPRVCFQDKSSEAVHLSSGSRNPLLRLSTHSSIGLMLLSDIIHSSKEQLGLGSQKIHIARMGGSRQIAANAYWFFHRLDLKDALIEDLLNRTTVENNFRVVCNLSDSAD